MSLPRLPSSVLMILFVLLCSLSASFGQWKTVVHLKQRYVYASQIPEYYRELGFTKTKRGGNSVRFTSKNKQVVIDFIGGSHEVYLNNVKFHFSYPVVPKGGDYLISQVDLVKLLDPILRPANIRSRGSFRTVVIDPGHGGHDPGASNKYGKEKNYTLTLAKKIKARLMKREFKVVLTREGDTYPSLTQRAEIANRYENAIFISLHFNSGGGGRAAGIETFSLSPPGVAHYGRGLRNSDLKVMAGNEQDTANIALATAIHGRTTRYLKARDRGIRRARYTVLTKVKHPAILFEGGFISHYKEAIKINNDGYLDEMAKRIFEGIVLYKNATAKRR